MEASDGKRLRKLKAGNHRLKDSTTWLTYGAQTLLRAAPQARTCTAA
jgi:hypothetical protein